MTPHQVNVKAVAGSYSGSKIIYMNDSAVCVKIIYWLVDKILFMFLTHRQLKQNRNMAFAIIKNTLH
jgi:hypothetical protein